MATPQPRIARSSRTPSVMRAGLGQVDSGAIPSTPCLLPRLLNVLGFADGGSLTLPSAATTLEVAPAHEQGKSITARCQRPLPPRPEETTPQEKAHIGANQVTGFSSSRQADRAGRATVAVIGLSLLGAIGRQVAEPIAPQLDVKALPAEPKHLGGRGAVVAGQLQRRLDAEPLDHVGGLPHQI